MRARRQAQDADVVIVNHHLLLADLALKEEGFGELLPGADAVIVDEAHQIPEVATQFFGVAVTQRQLLGLARDAEAEAAQHGAASVLAAGAAALTRAARDTRLAVGLNARRFPWDGLDAAGREQIEALPALLEAFGTQLDALAGVSAGLDGCRRRAADLAARLELICSDDEAAGLRWIEVFPQSFVLHLTPLDAAGSLSAAMEARACAWIFTSATLAVGDDFSHFSDRVGLGEVRALRLYSPFDFERNALLYLPQGLPDPVAPQYTQRALDAAWPLIQASEGRAFLLYTSHRALREAVAALSPARLSVPRAGTGHGTTRRAAAALSRARQCGAARHRQFLGGR